MNYKTYKNSLGGENIQRVNEDGSITTFCSNPANTDYQEYLKWVAEGNEPQPADEPNA